MTHAFTLDAIGHPAQGVIVTWNLLKAGDEGSPVSIPQWQKKTVSIEADEPALVYLYGASDVAGRRWRVTNDADGKVIDAPGLYVIQENPLFLFPQVHQGTGVRVVIVATH